MKTRKQSKLAMLVLALGILVGGLSAEASIPTGGNGITQGAQAQINVDEIIALRDSADAKDQSVVLPDNAVARAATEKLEANGYWCDYVYQCFYDWYGNYVCRYRYVCRY